MNSKLNQEIYRQLKVVAKKLMSNERNDHTLSPTDLVHEAFLKMEQYQGSNVKEDNYFFVLARQMRRLLVDYGRSKAALKRGANKGRVMYTDALGIANNSTVDFSIINDAIEDLKNLDDRASKAIDLYYFTKINRDQTAELLNISIPTLERDLRFAKAHISQYLSQNC